MASIFRVIVLLVVLAVFFELSTLVVAQPREPLEDYSEITEFASNVRIEYFYLESPTLAALIEELREKGPNDLQGKSRDAFTYWRISWRWPEDLAGWLELRCKLQARVTLPRWNPVRVPRPDEIERWRDFTKLLSRHEANHLRNVVKGYDQPCAAMRELAQKLGVAPTKEAAQQLADLKLEELRQFDRQYDITTDHGRTEGVRLKP